MIKRPLHRLRPPYEGPDTLHWFVGVARIVVLVMGVVGVYQFGELTIRAPGVSSQMAPRWVGLFLFGLYAFNLLSGFSYLSMLRRVRGALRFLTQTQVLLDFAVIAATISFTGEAVSAFKFLLVTVILEAGLLLGLTQGFVFAVLSTVFVGVQVWLNPHLIPGAEQWYDVLVQGLSYLFTAFVSGYWNQRIYRLKEFQREILDNMNSGFLITDEHGTVFAQNRAADRALNIAPGSAVGRYVGRVLRPDSGSECPVVTALRTQRDFTSYEFYAVVGPEQRRLLGLTTNCMYDRRRRPRGVIASFTDLTEVDAMRREMQRQDRMAALGELATGVAHEIRNPVAVIRGSVEELRGNLDAPAMAAKLAAIALRESDHLNDIVTEFLDFARNPVLHTEVFNACLLAQEAGDLLRRQHERAADLVIVNTPGERPCLVAGDPSKIKQVFMNLGTNAIEAMKQHGRLDITVLDAPGWIEILFDDTGPGLTPDQVARVFEPFYTTKESGVGMGLPVCLRIVTAHDGTIRIAPREGGGARVTVRLPAAQEGA